MKQAPTTLQTTNELKVALGVLIAKLEVLFQQLHEATIGHQGAQTFNGCLAKFVGIENVVYFFENSCASHPSR